MTLKELVGIADRKRVSVEFNASGDHVTIYIRKLEEVDPKRFFGRRWDKVEIFKFLNADGDNGAEKKFEDAIMEMISFARPE